MSKTMDAIRNLRKSLDGLYSAIKDDISPTKKEEEIIDEREEYINKVRKTLHELLSLNKQQCNSIEGYKDCSSEHLNFYFKTENYYIRAGKDFTYNSNFSKTDVEILNGKCQTILKKSDIYDIHCHDTEKIYSSSANWKEELKSVLNVINEDIKNAQKNAVISNIADMQKNFLDNAKESTCELRRP